MKKTKILKFLVAPMLVVGVLCSSGIGLYAVSYTHLDVYKRQVMCNAGAHYDDLQLDKR